MATILIRNARVLTLNGSREPRRGANLRELHAIEHGHVLIQDDRIAALGPGDPPSDSADQEIDARGCVVMPAFVDCHTHACWAGERYDEFEMRLKGASYLDILKSGGGIMATVRAVRDASEDELLELLQLRIGRMTALGTATAEIKSGYGLDTTAELKMLRVIHRLRENASQIIKPTFLGAHAKDPDDPQFVDRTISETLPAIADSFPGIPCDAYCEQGAWSLDETRRLFEHAQQLGLPLRVHADQFNSLGMTKLAVEMGAVSVDHLEASTPQDLACLARSSTMGVALPCSGFQLDDRYANMRAFIEAGGAAAIATNYNPGSAPTPSMPFTIALACRKLRLTPAEAIVCSTFNAACVLGVQDEVGSLEAGKRADVQILDCRDERELGYEFATPGPRITIVAGEVVHHRPAP